MALSVIRITSIPFNNSTIAPSIADFVSNNSTRIPFCVFICLKTIAVPIGITRSIGNAKITGRVVNITTIAAMLLKMAGAKSINNSFSSLTVPSRHRFNLPWMFPVIFSLKYDKGAFNNEPITIPLAFFSVFVAVSSTKILLKILMSSFTTLTTRIMRSTGMIFKKSSCSCIRISSVNHPIAFGVSCARIADTAIMMRINMKFLFCFQSNNAYNFCKILFKPVLCFI